MRATILPTKAPSSHPRRGRAVARRGFALVVVVSLLVLLSVVAVGLLGLSSLAVRAAGRESGLAEARANARLALLIAIGELQKQIGPDQRVTANGAILAESRVNHPQWTGIWDSWQAGPPDSSVRSPDEPSDHPTIPAARGFRKGMSPTYAGNRGDHFRSWLVSLRPEEAGDLAAARDLALKGSILPGPDSAAVQLVGDGTLGPADPASGDKDRVTARLLPIQSDTAEGASRGRFGWWVGDQSQKALLMDDPHAANQAPTLADRLARHQAPGSTGTRAAKGLENLKDEQQLAALPSLQSTNLLAGASGKPARSFHHLTACSRQTLADVREGGLKRDLTTLLERPVSESEKGDDYMLCKFDTKDQWLGGPDNQECVPIHDLAAFYQLYNGYRTGWKEGVRYGSTVFRNGIQISSPDFGAKSDADAYLREYTTLYRSPVPVKVQFLLSMFAEPVTPAPQPTRDNPDPDTHRLLIGITPSVTLWNPTNLPLVMRFDQDPNLYAQLLRMGNLPLQLSWNKNNGQFVSQKKNMFWFVSGADDYKPHLFNLYFSGTRPIRFDPGEVKVFSLPYKGDVSGLKAGYSGNWTGYAADFFFKTDKFYEPIEVVSGWEPRSFMLYRRSAPGGAPHVSDNKLTFKAGDKIAFEITGNNTALGEGARGSWVNFFMIQTNHQSYDGAGSWDRRNYQIDARTGSGADHDAFNERMLALGMRPRTTVITAAPRSGANIIARAKDSEGWPFLQFSFMAGTETAEASNGGAAGGRRFASRPFLHSTAIAASQLDGDDGNSLYNHGWNWWVEEINDVFEAPVQVSTANQGYYGGGYTPENGTTHVVQQEIPLVPPLSLAAFSHAHLGGFSLARDSVYYGYTNAQDPGSQRITATGQAGLFPHTLQAIGNSYAHPHIPADQAYVTWPRVFNSSEGSRNVILADHSYLANKALWDEFFFSSISPQPAAVKAFGRNRDLAAEEVAREFFFGGGSLPNRRMLPYTARLDKARLAGLYQKSQLFRDGLADRIAAHLMVEGAFNVNSTSVEAWKVFLSSLKGKPVAWLDKDKAFSTGLNLDQATPEGSPVGPNSLPNGKPAAGSGSDPSDPAQWSGWRELSDKEIEELAAAMVKQVKLRGPFLSLSEFVNRRLDAGNKDLSAKGALQAALDDPEVSINAGFRAPARRFGAAETGRMRPQFPAALEGPVAYGSAAYVDQADILRNFAEQLAPRGDTFVIRTYGDALDANGNVTARAWCEAVVQRVPDYLDPADEAHLRRANLTSAANKSFGRKLQLVAFRWLNPNEV